MAVLAEPEAINERLVGPESVIYRPEPSRGWGRLSYEGTFKRGLDLALAAAGLILSCPLWLLIALAIRIDSPGSVIFAQERVGQEGRRFRFYKFRSMEANAESNLLHLRHHNEMSGPVFKIRNDPRMTRVGKFLRRTSLDELPQLINVLKGEMSLVGPRPALPYEVRAYSPEDRIRLSVKPGITCLWQVRGRSTVGFKQWMSFDREYVIGLSFRLDLEILIRTVGAVLSCKGAF